MRHLIVIFFFFFLSYFIVRYYGTVVDEGYVLFHEKLLLYSLEIDLRLINESWYALVSDYALSCPEIFDEKFEEEGFVDLESYFFTVRIVGRLVVFLFWFTYTFFLYMLMLKPVYFCLFYAPFFTFVVNIYYHQLCNFFYTSFIILYVFFFIINELLFHFLQKKNK